MTMSKRDLMDHLVFLVMFNADPPPSEEEARKALEREFRSLASDERPDQPSV